MCPEGIKRLEELIRIFLKIFLPVAQHVVGGSVENFNSQAAMKPAQSARWKFVKVLLEREGGESFSKLIVIGRWSKFKHTFVVQVEVRRKCAEMIDKSGEEGELLGVRRVGVSEFSTQKSVLSMVSARASRLATS
jgi:hypothetical protein